jgi:nicotinamide-nucleotide amidase
MNAEIIAVGTELLMGQIANTNAQYISRRLADLGIRVLYHSVVGDNPQRLADSLGLALSRADVVILTGGLGPTKDDLTKETVAKAFGLPLILDEEVYGQIAAFFRKINREMVDSNAKQAYLPAGSIIIPNRNGTAPGCIILRDGKTVALFPGPPKEMIPMFEDTLFPWFEQKTGQVLASRMLRIFGIGESMMEDRILDLIEAQSNPTIAPYVGDGDVVVRVTASAPTRAEAEEMLDPCVAAILERLGDYVYATDGSPMEEVVGRLLMARGLKISVAESCTGGMISAKLVNVPGISAVFERGYVVYADSAKKAELGVSHSTLDRHGAVSAETALEMAEGLHGKTGCDVAVAVTGIAGPDGGTLGKPVGLVYVAVKTRTGTGVREFRINGNRERIRTVTSLHALDMVRRMLMAMPDR